MSRLSRSRRIIVWILLIGVGAATYLVVQRTSSSQWDQQQNEQISIEETDTDTGWTQRQAFFVQTATLEELQEWVSITKTWTIDGTQDITVSSQVSGRVSTIRVQQWDRISNGSTVIRLADSTGQLTFNAQRAQEWLDQARASYDQTVVSLDKAIVDTELAIRQAQNQALNAELGRSSSWASLQLQQLESQLDKAQVDLRNVEQSNDEQLESFEQSVENLFVTVELLYDDVIEAADSILWITTLRDRENETFEKYLWARNTVTLTIAKQELRELLRTQDQLRALNPDVWPWTLVSTLETLETYVQELQSLLDAVDEMLSFTTTGNSFSQTQLSWFTQQINLV